MNSLKLTRRPLLVELIINLAWCYRSYYKQAKTIKPHVHRLIFHDVKQLLDLESDATDTERLFMTFIS